MCVSPYTQHLGYLCDVLWIVWKYLVHTMCLLWYMETRCYYNHIFTISIHQLYNVISPCPISMSHSQCLVVVPFGLCIKSFRSKDACVEGEITSLMYMCGIFAGYFKSKLRVSRTAYAGSAVWSPYSRLNLLQLLPLPLISLMIKCEYYINAVKYRTVRLLRRLRLSCSHIY